MSTEILYRYALGQDGAPVDVFTLERDSVAAGDTYSCLVCGGEMIAKMGEINVKHFAHKSLTSQCAYETYLHQLAKAVFHQEYQRCLTDKQPFHLRRQLKATCSHYEKQYGYTCPRVETECHDLTRYFDQVFLEKSHQDFRPDVLLRSSRTGEVMFVEMAVTHPCEDAKIAGGLRILEYRPNCEDDLATLRSHALDGDDRRVTLHNFRQPPEHRPLCAGNCDARVDVFVVYRSRKSVLRQHKPAEDVESQIGRTAVYHEIVGKSSGNKDVYRRVFRQKVREAYFKGIPVSNCFLCKYHGGDSAENAVYCKISREPVPSNTAVECDLYRPMRTWGECQVKDRMNDRYAVRKRTSPIVNEMVRVMLPKPEADD